MREASCVPARATVRSSLAASAVKVKFAALPMASIEIPEASRVKSASAPVPLIIMSPVP